MVLRVFNTMSGKLEEFKPLRDKHVGIYVCGPTVYDWAHLGHARTQQLTEVEKGIEKKVEKLKAEFVEAMDEDFNGPRALVALFDLSREINRFLGEQKQVNTGLLKRVYEGFLELGKVLGLFQKERAKKVSEKLVDDLVNLLVELRENLRRGGDFEFSDEVRAKLRELGVVVEDTSEGSKWKLA